jgi:hypothetical protein
MIIAAFAGTGKTTLANLYPRIVIDFCCMPYKYHIDKDNEFTEANKASFDFDFHEEWPYNYVKAIKQNISGNKVLLIPSDRYVLSLLEKDRINYTLCYPQRNAKEIYYKRFIDRGNSENFINIFISKWDNFMDILEADSYGKHIVLEPDQFLSDVIDIYALLEQEKK